MTGRRSFKSDEGFLEKLAIVGIPSRCPKSVIRNLSEIKRGMAPHWAQFLDCVYRAILDKGNIGRGFSPSASNGERAGVRCRTDSFDGDKVEIAAEGEARNAASINKPIALYTCS